MSPDLQGESRKFLQGASGLVITLLIVGILLIALPAYRWFFLVSVLLGLAIAGLLLLWHKLRPIKEDDVNHRRPLGLD
jgi:MFS family permease